MSVRRALTLPGHSAQPARHREVEGRPRQSDAVFRLTAKEADVGLFHGRPVSGGFVIAIKTRGNPFRSLKIDTAGVKIWQS